MGHEGCRNKSRASRAEAGFTLVEVLIAIVVLVFGLIAVTNLLVVAATSNRVGNDMTAAAAGATRTMDDLKALPFGDPGLATGGNLGADVAGFFRDDLVQGVSPIHVRWQIAAVPGNAQILFIAVQAEGTGIGSSRSRVQFTTFRACTDRPIGCPLP